MKLKAPSEMRALACLFVALLAVSCGEEKTQFERPLSSSEAAVLAEVLWQNYESGGAHFRLSSLSGLPNGTISIEGGIDWKQHLGHGLILGGSQPNPVTEVWWDENTVVERRPDLDKELEERLIAGRIPVLVRSPNVENRRLDQLLAVLTGLAAKNPENSQLILQTEGSSYIRNDVLRDQPVVLLRYGKRSIYWINTTTKAMMRFESIDSSGQYPVIVDLLELGPQELEIPSDIQMIDLAANEELLQFIPMSP